MPTAILHALYNTSYRLWKIIHPAIIDYKPRPRIHQIIHRAYNPQLDLGLLTPDKSAANVCHLFTISSLPLGNGIVKREKTKGKNHVNSSTASTSHLSPNLRAKRTNRNISSAKLQVIICRNTGETWMVLRHLKARLSCIFCIWEVSKSAL